MIKFTPGKILSIIVMLSGIIVMIGWFFDIDPLKRIFPGLVTMKFSTAFSFLVCGALLFVTELRQAGEKIWTDLLLPSFSMLIAIMMGTALISVIFGFKSGVESLFVKETAEAILTSVPGRPSIGTMASFIIVALLGIIAMSQFRLKKMLYRIGGLIISIIGFIAVVGYMFSIPLMYYLFDEISTAMALHTALLFIVLGAGYFYVGRIKSRF